MPDYRFTLQDIENVWSTCKGCDLGVRRHEVGGNFVFGEGHPNGIMFIGEGPGATEEAEGRPFVGRSGTVLREIIRRLNIEDCSYITNVVTCRSCAPAYNGEGRPIMRRDRNTGEYYPLIRDEEPNPLQIATCLPRLHEEIYLVDPKIIVTLGSSAAKTLIKGRSFSIMSERGKLREISIPGAAYLPSLTAKKKVWVRKVRGQVSIPIVQKRVYYPMFPTYHPAFILRRQADRSFKNPLDVFIDDIKAAVRIYDKYLELAFGAELQERELNIEDLVE